MRLKLAIAAGSLALLGGCIQVLGLEGWKDPPGTGGGSSTSSGSTGGAPPMTTTSSGGAATSSSSTSSTSSTTTSSTSSTTTSASSGAGGALPTCFDGEMNGQESDVDCGGDACLPCIPGKHCNSGSDCASGTCAFTTGAGVCASEGGPPGCEVGLDPTCNDCIQNADESDVDCGGELCLACGAGKKCVLDGDCLSAHCNGGTCATGTMGKPCKDGGDCVSGQCGFGTCITGSCCQ